MTDLKISSEIARLKQRLKDIESGNVDVVFVCPVCGGRFVDLVNYQDLGMCMKCWVQREKTRRKELLKTLNGATVVDFTLSEPEPLSPCSQAVVTELKLKTTEGKTIRLKELQYIVMIA